MLDVDIAVSLPVGRVTRYLDKLTEYHGYLRRKIETFPKDYKSNPKQKLNQEQIKIYAQMQKLEQQVMVWEKTKEKIKKMLWWDDVAKGLTKLNQANGTHPENTNITDTKAIPTDSAPPATLSADGRAWFIHPVAMVDYFNVKEKKTETWDSVTNSRIALLHPRIRQQAINFINDVEKEFGVQLRVTTGLRTFDEQNRLYNQGRTTPGKIVTWVRGGYSYHNYGLAIDVIEIKNKKANWAEKVLIRISSVGIRHGFSWGGDWKKQKDYPHFEITFNYKTSELLKKHEKGKLDGEGYIIFD